MYMNAYHCRTTDDRDAGALIREWWMSAVILLENA